MHFFVCINGAVNHYRIKLILLSVIIIHILHFLGYISQDKYYLKFIIVLDFLLQYQFSYMVLINDQRFLTQILLD